MSLHNHPRLPGQVAVSLRGSSDDLRHPHRQGSSSPPYHGSAPPAEQGRYRDPSGVRTTQRSCPGDIRRAVVRRWRRGGDGCADSRAQVPRRRPAMSPRPRRCSAASGRHSSRCRPSRRRPEPTRGAACACETCTYLSDRDERNDLRGRGPRPHPTVAGSRAGTHTGSTVATTNPKPLGRHADRTKDRRQELGRGHL